MSNLSHSSTSSTGGAETGGATGARPRFCSAPSPTTASPWPPRLPNSFWYKADEIGKYLHHQSKWAISNYAPSRFQSWISLQADALSERIGYAFNEDTRSWISDFWSDKVIGRDQSTNWHRISIAVILAAVSIVSIFLLQSLITGLVLGLGLPFYAILSFVYWYTSWRVKSWNSNHQPTLRMLNFLWCGAALMDLLISVVILCTRMSSNGHDSWILEGVLKYIFPILTFIGAKFYLDRNGINSKGEIEEDVSNEETEHDATGEKPFQWLLEYFLLTYAVRCFSFRGFNLLPQSIRPLFGYLSCYIAVSSASRKSSEKFGQELCDQCCPGSGRARASGGIQKLSPQFVLPSLPVFGGGGTSGAGATGAAGGGGSLRNRFHLPDTDIRSMAAAGGRGSRRVSLPAGSLLPIKAAQSNLSEARGMLADMLAQKDLPPHLVAGLKAVGSLLAQGPKSNLPSLDFLDSLPRVLDSPYIGGDVSLASIETAANRRQSPAVAWSTTTSATGLPTLEPEPSRTRSSSYWKQKNLAEGEDESKAAMFKQSIDLPAKMLQLSDGTVYDIGEMQKDQYLARLKEWGLPIFEMYNDCPDTILSRSAYTIFQRSGLFRIFKINKQKFMSFFHALEKGYWSIPYHNRIHATDVLQATYYFTCHKVPQFAGSVKSNHPLSAIGEQPEDDSDVETGDSDRAQGLEVKSPTSSLDDPSGTLASILSSLELMGLYTAAAMHDFDHPGRTNAFLVAIQDKKAILYNDRSVLENHHAASAWQLLTKPENNFVEQLDSAEFKRLRYIIIEAILATDLKRHFEILMDFNGKVSKGLDWDNEVDKLLTSQICIKMADINSPTKPGALHKDWTDRILEEFYAQGDEEKERGLPVSPYMDRHDAQLARLQDSFIAHLVAPLAMAMNEAGLLPLTTLDSSGGVEAMKSELLVNLAINHKHWKIELGEDPESGVQAAPHASSFAATVGHVQSPLEKDEDEMETIEEQDDENGNDD